MRTPSIFAILVAALCLLATPTAAYVVDVYTQFDPIQDDWIIEGQYHEKGNQSVFPYCQQLDSEYLGETTTEIPCPNEYGGGVNVIVSITNLCPYAYEEVYYVGDSRKDDQSLLETNLTNWDEWVGQVTDPFPGKAFKIDSVGENKPLIYESKTRDDIWEPFETWHFVIQEYSNIKGLGPQLFGSLGIASFSVCDTCSSGSILVPEPASLALLALGGLALIRRRRT